jgi:hypothetical protein
MDVCEGDRIIDVRAQHGRFVRRLAVKPGEMATLKAVLRPAFALIASAPDRSRERQLLDLNLAVERAFAAAQLVSLYTPQGDEAERASAAANAPAGWLTFGRDRRPLEPSGGVPAATRRQIAASIAKTLGAQGVAVVAPVPGGGPGDIFLTLLAAGASEPDVIETSLEDRPALARALERLNEPTPLFRTTAGVRVIDVLDAKGAVVVDADGADPAKPAPGEQITKAGDQPIAGAGAFNAYVAGRRAGEKTPIEILDRQGAARTATVETRAERRLLSLDDAGLAPNVTIAHLRGRLAESPSPAEESALRLNLAAALIRVGAFEDALAELSRVQIPAGPGVSSGTVFYLRGVSLEALGRTAEAEQAWQAAAMVDGSLVTEDGPSVKDAAAERLRSLRRPRQDEAAGRGLQIR